MAARPRPLTAIRVGIHTPPATWRLVIEAWAPFPSLATSPKPNEMSSIDVASTA